MVASELFICQQEIRAAGNPYPKRGQITKRIIKELVKSIASFTASTTPRLGRQDSDGYGVDGVALGSSSSAEEHLQQK